MGQVRERGTIHFEMFLYVGIVLFQRVLSKSISNGTTDALEKSFESLLSRFNNTSVNLNNFQTKVQHEKKHSLYYVGLTGITWLNTNSIGKFNTQLIDGGNNFNTGDGIFVAHISGVYFFSWTIQTSSSQSVQTELTVDNIVKGKRLMEVGSGAYNYLYDAQGGVRSSFMGLFIQEN